MGHSFKTEAELCEALSTAARALGFKVFSETAGFDLLLVSESAKGFDAGDQIGVEAKLRANWQVLYQALPRPLGIHHPDFYCVLVPTCDRDYCELAGRLEISVIVGHELVGSDLHMFPFDMHRRRRWYRQRAKGTCWVPDVEVVGMAAGTKSPLQITQWKMNAIKVCMRGVHNGFLTKKDFEECHVSMPRFLEMGWIKGYDMVREGKKRVKRYVLVDEAMPPHLKFAQITDALGEAGLV